MRICAYEKCNNEFEPDKFHPHQKYCCKLHCASQWKTDNKVKLKGLRKKTDKKYAQSIKGIITRKKARKKWEEKNPEYKKNYNSWYASTVLFQNDVSNRFIKELNEGIRIKIG